MATRRIGIIGDVHARDGALATAIEALRGMGAETLLCTGDIVDGQGSVDACCALLREHQVATIRGNHERWFLANTMRDLPFATLRDQVSPTSMAYLSSLPPTIE